MSVGTVLPPEMAAPEVIHSCPSCSHWLPDGTLACPDCATLTYGAHLSGIAAQAQQLERDQKWPEAREMWRSALPWLPENTRQAESIQQHVALIDARLKAEDDTKAKWKKRLGPLAPVALFLLKVKSWFFLLFKLKFLFSALLYFAFYWALWGWKFALGFTLSIFLHEMGHYFAAKRRGLKADMPIFRLLGAYVRWYGSGVSREDLASIALAGPFAGLLTALVCFAIFKSAHVDPLAVAYNGGYGMLFLVLANMGAWMNLINLFPIEIGWLTLDGAMAVYALSRLQRGMIAASCLLMFALSARGAIDGDLVGPHTMWSFLIVGLGMAWRCFRSGDVPEKPSMRTFVYFQGLVIALGLLMFVTDLPVR